MRYSLSGRVLLVSMMKSRFDLATAATAVCLAAYAAIALASTAYYFELSPQEIRIVAVSIAIIVSMLIAIDFFGKKLGKLK
jgi:drug/metabolite transporter (DMT)-like permease